MKRFGQLMMGLMLMMAWSAAAAQAQPMTDKWSAQLDAAATFGHASSTSVGGEVDYRWKDNWELAFEVGHFGNITTQPLQNRANVVANAINTINAVTGIATGSAAANPIQKAVYYDLGLRYHLMPDGKWNPYVALGFGAARVNTGTTFTVGGVLVPDLQGVHGVQLGDDLDGHVTKAFLLFGVGVNMPVKKRYLVDASYRYGRVFPSGSIDSDAAVNTQRVQIGFGFRF